MSPSLLLAVALVVGDAVASALPTAGEPGSVARAKCQEYSDAVFAKGKAEPADQCLSGYNIPDNDNAWFAKPKEFPHMAHIGYGDASEETVWQCGGSLISPNFVLTSASCLNSPFQFCHSDIKLHVCNNDASTFDPRRYRIAVTWFCASVVSQSGLPRWVRLGAVSAHNDTTGDKPQVIGVDKIFRHPDYKVAELYNDIALLRLERPAELSDLVRPACVNTEPALDPAVVPVATGWGLTEFNGDPSETLKKVPISLADYAKCSKAYAETNSRRLPLGIVDASHVCAGGDGKADTCQGDTGGPLQVPTRGPEPRCMHKVVGITSFGKFCFQPGAPGVYTRVSYFVPWIESIVWPGH